MPHQGGGGGDLPQGSRVFSISLGAASGPPSYPHLLHSRNSGVWGPGGQGASLAPLADKGSWCNAAEMWLRALQRTWPAPARALESRPWPSACLRGPQGARDTCARPRALGAGRALLDTAPPCPLPALPDPARQGALGLDPRTPGFTGLSLGGHARDPGDRRALIPTCPTPPLQWQLGRGGPLLSGKC